MFKIRLIFVITSVFAILSPVYALQLHGKIYDKDTKAPVPYAIIIIQEEEIKTYSAEDGSYKLEIKKPGEYTLRVNHSEWKPFSKSMKIESDLEADIYLSRFRVIGKSLTVNDKREIQKVSRYTMSADDTKISIGSSNDILAAFQNIPGVIINTTPYILGAGSVGGITVRGAKSEGNVFYIDDIPVLTPMHMGGLHTIISSDIISEVDLFSSAYPARYGNATSAVFSMNTLDNIDKQSWILSGGFISANGTWLKPLYKEAPVLYPEPTSGGAEESQNADLKGAQNGAEKEYKGYVMSSARLAYIPLAYGLILEIEKKILELNQPQQAKAEIQQTPQTENPFPYYFDYQLKLKYFITKDVSLKFFLMGYGNYKVENPIEPSTYTNTFTSPFSQNKLMETDMHTQSAYLTWQPSEKFSNQLLLFNSIYIDRISAKYYTGLHSSMDIFREMNPNLHGLRNESRLNWINDKTYLNLGLEYTMFNYASKGYDVENGNLHTNIFSGTQVQNITDGETRLLSFEKSILNHLLSGYINNRFQFDGFIFDPGFRISYLNLNGEWTYDPRMMMSYEFPTRTTLSLAGGHYSSYLQTNANYLFLEPNLLLNKTYVSEKSWQSTMGIEQLIDPFTVRGELFYNYYYDMSQWYFNPAELDEYGNPLTRISSGTGRNYGFEIFLKKEMRENERGPFGWVSYTYTSAEIKTGVPDQSYKDMYINSPVLARHAIKTLLGWRFKHQSISFRFNMWSPFPVTKVDNIGGIVNSGDVPYTEIAPDLLMELDFRFTWFATTNKGGKLTLYIELLMLQSEFYHGKISYVPAFEPGEVSHWDTAGSSGGLPFLPNFGIEYKF